MAYKSGDSRHKMLSSSKTACFRKRKKLKKTPTAVVILTTENVKVVLHIFVRYYYSQLPNGKEVMVVVDILLPITLSLSLNTI